MHSFCWEIIICGGQTCSWHTTTKASNTEVGVLYKSEKSNPWLCRFMCHACFAQLWTSARRQPHFTQTSSAADGSVQPPPKVLLLSMHYFCLQGVPAALTIHHPYSSLGGQGREWLKQRKRGEEQRRMVSEKSEQSCLGDKWVELFPVRPSSTTTSAMGGPIPWMQVRCTVLMRLSSLGQTPAPRHCQLYDKMTARFQKFLFHPV